MGAWEDDSSVEVSGGAGFVDEHALLAETDLPLQPPGAVAQGHGEHAQEDVGVRLRREFLCARRVLMHGGKEERGGEDGAYESMLEAVFWQVSRDFALNAQQHSALEQVSWCVGTTQGVGANGATAAHMCLDATQAHTGARRAQVLVIDGVFGSGKTRVLTAIIRFLALVSRAVARGQVTELPQDEAAPWPVGPSEEGGEGGEDAEQRGGLRTVLVSASERALDKVMVDLRGKGQGHMARVATLFDLSVCHSGSGLRGSGPFSAADADAANVHADDIHVAAPSDMVQATQYVVQATQYVMPACLLPYCVQSTTTGSDEHMIQQLQGLLRLAVRDAHSPDAAQMVEEALDNVRQGVMLTRSLDLNRQVFVGTTLCSLSLPVLNAARPRRCGTDAARLAAKSQGGGGGGGGGGWWVGGGRGGGGRRGGAGRERHACARDST